MPYRDRLNSWAVVRLLPKLQRVVISRHRSESDADGHCQVLRRLEPDAEFIVMFDPVAEERSSISSAQESARFSLRWR